ATLGCVDDTAPKLVSTDHLSAGTPLRLTFDEPVSASGFDVSVAYFDYSGKPASNAASDFELASAGNAIEVRPKSGTSIQNNRQSTVVVRGIADRAGNSAAGGGVYTETLRARDTLAPRDLVLTRLSDGQAVTSAMLLSRGRAYDFVPAATDNAPGG